MKTSKGAARKPGLLDVNVPIALIDPAHEFHAAAHVWFQRDRQYGWATCPITENGWLRILSKPGYPFPGLTVPMVRDILFRLAESEGHRFWPDAVSILEPNRFELVGAGPKNLTDLYLLRLATSFNGRLITFNRTIRREWLSARGRTTWKYCRPGKDRPRLPQLAIRESGCGNGPAGVVRITR